MGVVTKMDSIEQIEKDKTELQIMIQHELANFESRTGMKICEVDFSRYHGLAISSVWIKVQF